MCQLFIILINNSKATLMSSQAHAKSNKKEILSTFVTVTVVIVVLIVN